jgi:penicillin-binding protein 1C
VHPRRKSYRYAALLALSLAVILLLRFWPRNAIAAAIPRSTAVYARGGELLRLTLAGDGQYRLWTDFDALPPRFAEAVVRYEDREFYWHPGVNPWAVLRAAMSNLTGKRRVGASTISMQLARRLYGIDTKSIGGKLRQMALAMWLEARYGKRDILEAYLNLAPYGRNVEGIGAASLAYYGRAAGGLSISQLMTLAVVPQNPQLRGPSLQSPSEASSRDAARARLWNQWLRAHPEDEIYSGEMRQPLEAKELKALPFLAPHFTDQLIRQASGEIQSTLDLRTQRAVERILHNYVEENASVGIRNAGALLLEVADDAARIRAYVGSADYRNAEIGGQVNAITAKRSPGSLLKPFVYTLAIDQGLLTPRTILKDAPTSFGPFSPENFDGRFVGPIAAEDALIRSRNVPAVEVASRLSHPNLYDFLSSAGVSRLNAESHYGLALTLGGGEVSMEELGRMYATLQNSGRLPDLQYREEKAANGTLRLFSDEASYVALDMLAKNPRPDTGQPASPTVSWKTGTSWGFHDAWSAGVFGRYVLIVWIGNFDNTGNPAFVGVQAAAPLFFRTIDAVRSQGLVPHESARPVPTKLSRIEVCTASGDLPNAECPQTTSTWYIPGKSPFRESILHQRIYLSATGNRVCGPGPGIREAVFEFWPSDMLKLFREAGLPRRVAPPAPQCSGSPQLADKEAPRITSPLRGVTYTLRIGHPEPLMLRATTPTQVHGVYWFAGNTYLGNSGDELPWRPPSAGHYVLRAVDEYGGSDSRDVEVEMTN